MRGLFFLGALLISVLCAGCAGGPPGLPYPAFIQVDELDDIFMASVPGSRAKQLAGDPQTRRTSNRIDLPRDWQGTSGGAPGRSMEIFVLSGVLQVADMSLTAGGYLYLPAGSLGFNLAAKEGARILYFVNDADPAALIRTPIVLDSRLLDWEPSERNGVEVKELRYDPGNGSRTWLRRVRTGANQAWESVGAVQEGYLVTGNQQYSECVNGEIRTWSYSPGGYFLRPENTIHGGPESVALNDAVWFLRQPAKAETQRWPDCVAPATSPAG